MAERGDPARNHMPSGLRAIDILGDGGRIALVIRRSKHAQGLAINTDMMAQDDQLKQSFFGVRQLFSRSTTGGAIPTHQSPVALLLIERQIKRRSPVADAARQSTHRRCVESQF
jgi:hypothetical protein